MLNRFLQDSIINLALCALLFFNFSVWNLTALGIILFLAYFLLNSAGCYLALIKFFHFSANGFRIKILGVFSALMLLGFFVGLAIIFYRITPLSLSLTFLLNGILLSYLKSWAKFAPNTGPAEIDESQLAVLDEMPSPIFGLLFFLALVAYGFYLLAVSKTSASVLSPWQVINQNYIFVFLCAALELGILILSNLKAKVLLFLIILLTALQHSYLPLTHELIYGADGWRHIAAESRLLDGGILDEVALSEEPLGFWHRLDLGKISYSQFWGLNIFFAKIFNISLLTVNAWLVPIVWSIVFPILLFELGKIIGLGKKQSLFLAWLGLLPFAWQAGGAFTLPVNLGFLWWLLLCLLILQNLKNARREQTYILIATGVISFFSYAVYFLLFWWGYFSSYFLKQKIKAFTWGLLAAVSIFVFPLVEIIAKYSHINTSLNLLSQVKQLVGNFTGWYLAAGPRPHDIATGNVIINQTPSYAFVANALTVNRYWLVVVVVIFLFLVIYGLVISFKGKNTEQYWFAVMSVLTGGGYIIGRYFLAGEQVLSRRLDIVLALMMLVLGAIAIQHIFDKYLQNFSHKKELIIAGVFILGVTGTVIYSLGPDTNTVSADEYQAMSAVWSQEKDNKKVCVIADTYPLLALEAISRKKIIGGGFPINEYFAQPERAQILDEFKSNPAPSLFAQSENLTKASHCYYVGPSSALKINNFVENYYKNFIVFDKIIIWEYND